jgi:nucleoside-diphosphate-sugar epimerase
MKFKKETTWSADKSQMITADFPIKCMVIGGCGFIGHNVSRMCHDMGLTIEVVDTCTHYGIYPPKEHEQKIMRRLSRMPDVPVHKIPIENEEAIDQVVGQFKPSTIIHLASIPVASLSISHPMMASNQMILGTVSILEAARKHGVKRVLYVSSSMVYGEFQSRVACEDHPKDPHDIYGNLKLASERLVRSYTKIHDLDHVIVRPSAVYGPTGNDTFVITKFVESAINNQKITIRGADTRLDFTYVEDAARGITMAALSDSSINQTFNITCGNSRKLTEVVEHLEKIVGKIEVEIDEPETAYPRRGTLDISRARNTFGYQPQFQLEDGLENMIREYQS